MSDSDSDYDNVSLINLDDNASLVNLDGNAATKEANKDKKSIWRKKTYTPPDTMCTGQNRVPPSEVASLTVCVLQTHRI